MSAATRHRDPTLRYGIIALAATALLALAMYFWLDWAWFRVWTIGVNVVTFLFYRYDKRRAQHPDATRVPESVLLLLTVVGGFAGAWAGMFLPPRHKTRKPLFWAAAIGGTLLWIFVWYWVTF
jgi:uncharacterized membrane protein YsdA (DUF1294 family)